MDRITDRMLLIIDAWVNMLLGVLLVLFPLGLAGFLGVPATATHFYPSPLGAVLIGIGIALMIEAYGRSGGRRGLGLAGAMAINFCGAGALTLWLVAAPPDIPLRGRLLLWTIAIAVTAIGLLELAGKSATPSGGSPP